MHKEPEIYCPCCQWRPRGDSRWTCATRQGGCGTVWNTFWTAGCCPGCGHLWEYTQCLACKRHSRHPDWYHYPPDGVPAMERELEHEA